jgi:hypothetical protein
VAQENGCETRLGRLKIAPRLFPATAQVADGFVLDLRDIDRGESARAPQAGPLDRITTGRVDPIAGLVREQRGGHHPADVAVRGERAGGPIPPWPRFIDKDRLLAVGRQFPDALVAIAWARTDGAEGEALSMVFVGDRGDGHRVLMAIHPDGERARLGPG